MVNNAHIFSLVSSDVQEQNNDSLELGNCSLSFQNLMKLCKGNLIIASDDNLPMINSGLYNGRFSF